MIDARTLDRMEHSLTQILAAITEQTADHLVSCVPIQRTLMTVDRVEEILPANPRRMKWMLFSLGPGDVYWSSAPQAGGGYGMPILAAGGPTNPYRDDWPAVHRGPIYAAATAANTRLVVIEWSRDV